MPSLQGKSKTQFSIMNGSSMAAAVSHRWLMGKGPLRFVHKIITRFLMSMGQSPWDDMKILVHCSVFVCLYVCLCVHSGAISKFWVVPCSSKSVLGSFISLDTQNKHDPPYFKIRLNPTKFCGSVLQAWITQEPGV